MFESCVPSEAIRAILMKTSVVAKKRNTNKLYENEVRTLYVGTRVYKVIVFKTSLGKLIRRQTNAEELLRRSISWQL